MTLKEKLNKWLLDIKDKFSNNSLQKFKEKCKEFNENKFSNFNFDKKTIIIIISSFCFVLFLGCFFIAQGNNKSYVIKKIGNILEKGNSKDLSKMLVAENLNKKLTSEDVEPVINFYDDNRSRISDLTSSLSSDKSIYSMTMKESDKFLGKKYYIATKFKELTINTDIDGANLYINGASEGVIKGKEKKINLIVPGVYKIKVEYKGNDASLVSEKDITLTENESISIPLNGMKISVNTQYPDGKIYINNESTNIKAKDFKNKGPFPTDGSYKISMKYNSPWGEISSEPIEINNNPEINIGLELKNENLKAQLKTLMEDFYNSVFIALNKKNKDEIKGITDEVKEKIYSILNEKYTLLKNIYKLDNLDVDLNKSNIKFENGQYTGTVVTTVNYLIKKDMFGIPLQSKSVSQSFFVNVIYKDGSWVINNLDGFSLEQ